MPDAMSARARTPLFVNTRRSSLSSSQAYVQAHSQAGCIRITARASWHQLPSFQGVLHLREAPAPAGPLRELQTSSGDCLLAEGELCTPRGRSFIYIRKMTCRLTGKRPFFRRLAVLVFALLIVGGDAVPASRGAFPDPSLDVQPTAGKQTAVLAGGCFWCMEAVFKLVDGVDDVISGYSGGTQETAKYDIVSTGRTGHAESVLITYDPAKTSYGQLLKIFFSVAHDPTTLNRQGPDVGLQYRSVIFYANQEQKRVAEAYIKQIDAAHVLDKPIVTQVVPLDKFYTAEAYHQNYAAQHRSNPYIVSVADPKVEKLRKLYPGCVRKR